MKMFFFSTDASALDGFPGQKQPRGTHVEFVRAQGSQSLVSVWEHTLVG